MNYVKAIFTALKATSAKIDWNYFKKVEDWNEDVGSALTPVSDISRLTEVSGDGLTSGYLHDKSGCRTWTNYGLTAVDGFRGKAISADGTSYAVADSPVIGTTFSINRQFKRSTVGTIQTLFDNTDSSGYNGTRLFINASNALILRIGGSSSYHDVTIQSGVTDTTSRHTCGASLTGTTLKTYYDGVLQNTTTLSVTPTASSTNATLCRESATAQNFAVDNDGIFRSDARVLTDAEFLSWHNDPRSVDSTPISATPNEGGIMLWGDNSFRTYGILTESQINSTSGAWSCVSVGYPVAGTGFIITQISVLGYGYKTQRAVSYSTPTISILERSYDADIGSWRAWRTL